MMCLHRVRVPDSDAAESFTAVSLYRCAGTHGVWFNVETATAQASCSVRFITSLRCEAERVFASQVRECIRAFAAA